MKQIGDKTIWVGKKLVSVLTSQRWNHTAFCYSLLPMYFEKQVLVFLPMDLEQSRWKAAGQTRAFSHIPEYSTLTLAILAILVTYKKHLRLMGMLNPKYSHLDLIVVLYMKSQVDYHVAENEINFMVIYSIVDSIHTIAKILTSLLRSLGSWLFPKRKSQSLCSSPATMHSCTKYHGKAIHIFGAISKW